jgi:hypothetical protein
LRTSCRLTRFATPMSSTHVDRAEERPTGRAGCRRRFRRGATRRRRSAGAARRIRERAAAQASSALTALMDRPGFSLASTGDCPDSWPAAG